MGAAAFAVLAAVFALAAWLIVRHSRGDHGADIALAAVIGGAIGAVFGPPLFDRWLGTRQAAEDKVKREEAELLRDAESLVLSMHEYSDGYRELSGHLLGFSEHWTDKQRGKAMKRYGKWMDRREIAREIRMATMRLDKRCSELASSRQAERELPALRDLRNAANTYLDFCVETLISWKTGIPSRQMFDSAIRNARTMEDAKLVREWAERIFSYISNWDHILTEADTALAQLQTALRATSSTQWRERADGWIGPRAAVSIEHGSGSETAAFA